MYNLCQYPVAINTQRSNANVENERRISSGILVETIIGFKWLKLQSTINDSAYYNSEEDVAKSDTKRYPLLDTCTSDGNNKKALILTLSKEIIHKNYWQTEKCQRSSKASSCRLTKLPRMGLCQVEGICMRAFLHKEIVTGATRSAAGVMKYHPVVNWNYTGGTITVDRDTVGILPRTLPRFGLVLDPLYPQLS